MRRLSTALILSLLACSAVAFERQPNDAYRSRRERLGQRLNGGVAVLFAAVEAEGQNSIYGFRQNDNFYYLTGLRDPGAALVIAGPAEASGSQPARPYEEILFLPAHNRSQEKWTGPKLAADDANVADTTGFGRTAVLDRMRDELVRILPQPAATVFMDQGGDSASNAGMQWLRRANAFPNYVTYRDVNALVSDLRTVKDAGEIELVRKATDASVEGHKAAMRSARSGMTENELAALMKYEFERRGCEKPAYAPVVGSGLNSTVLHYSQSSGMLRDGDVVVLDVGGEYSGYATDITRTLPVGGHFTTRQREIYDIVYGAQQAAIAAFEAGKSTMSRTSPGSLFRVAYEYINSHGKDLHGQPLGQYFIHGLSHFVGLSVHDPGDPTLPLEPGMIFTIEPGIYIPEEKLGVRIEDTFLVGADGKLVNLSGALPSKAGEVEAMMRR
jgi:Xaa-Pro aminopeptidase